jgi:hypothetical protein
MGTLNGFPNGLGAFIHRITFKDYTTSRTATYCPSSGVTNLRTGPFCADCSRGRLAGRNFDRRRTSPSPQFSYLQVCWIAR